MTHVYALINENIVWIWDAFVGTTVRTSMLLALVVLGLSRWKRSSSAQRHLIWGLACLGMLGIPLAQLIVPAWNLPILPAATSPFAVPLMTPELFTGSGDLDAVTMATTAQASTVTTASDVLSVRFPGIAVLLAVWVIGMVCMLIRVWNSHRHIHQLVARSVPVKNHRIIDMMNRVQRELGIRRIVSVRYQQWEIPFVYGVMRPVILLPFGAEAWGAARLRDVLVHEVAHVKRWDGVTQILTSIVCAIYWFNPLVWVAAQALRNERESACDDYVLASGTKASDYATHLLEFTNNIRTNATLFPSVLAFAYPTSLQNRLHSIIAPNKRRAPLRPLDYMLVCGILVCIVFSLSAFAPVPRNNNKSIQRELISVASISAAANEVNESSSTPDSPAITPRNIPTNLSTSLPMISTMKHIVAPAVMAAMVSAVAPTRGNAQNTAPAPVQGGVARTNAQGRVQSSKFVTPVDSPTRIRIRSTSSIPEGSRKAHPLFVIDGIVTDLYTFQELDPNTIVKINVIKSEAAIEKYGLEADGGAIEITTGPRTTDSVAQGGVQRERYRLTPNDSSETPRVQKLSELLNRVPTKPAAEAKPTGTVEPPFMKLSDLLKSTVPPTSELR